MSSYHPEKYWSKVAKRIDSRSNNNVIAGDDEPYYRYKRDQFLKVLHHLDVKGKSVLEVGCGPGGNLIEIYKSNPSKLSAVDISHNMVRMAKSLTNGIADIHKVDGTTLPFGDKSKDIVFTSTVLQHNTDEAMLFPLIKEMARVAKEEIYLFERIEEYIKGDDLCLGRPVQYYADQLLTEGFRLVGSQFLDINVSYYTCGVIRKLLNPSSRGEGEPMSALATILQSATLPITKTLDKVFPSKRDVAMLHFRRIN